MKKQQHIAKLENMKTIGTRKIRALQSKATSDSLIRGAQFNEEIHRLPSGDSTGFPKGVYRYKTHEDAEDHWNENIARGMADIARGKRA